MSIGFDDLVKWQHGLHCNMIGHGQLQSIKPSMLAKLSQSSIVCYSSKFSLESQTLITQVDQWNCDKVLCEWDVALEWYGTYSNHFIAKNQ